MNARRRLALWLADRAARVAGESEWGRAARAETENIADDGAALRWAAGALVAWMGERLMRSPWIARLAALPVLFFAFDQLFAPLMIAAWRLDATGLLEGLGGMAPGDRYQRFIPLMEATPGWLVAIGVGAALLYFAAFVQLLRDRANAIGLLAGAAALHIASYLAANALGQWSDGYRAAHEAAFAAQPTLLRHLMLAGFALVPLAILAFLVWRDRQPDPAR